MSVRGVMVSLASAAIASTLSLVAPMTAAATETRAGGFVVGESQFNAMFPGRNPFYTYRGLTDALSAYPGFANTGGSGAGIDIPRPAAIFAAKPSSTLASMATTRSRTARV